MLRSLRKDYPSGVVVTGIIVLILELAFFKSGLIFPLFISVMMIYLGRKRRVKKRGKLMLWSGILFTCITIFSLITFQFLIAAFLIHFIVQFFQSKQKPKEISPFVTNSSTGQAAEPLITKKPLLDNVLVGQQKTPDYAYEWNNINIQAGIGDTIIDFSNTILPKGESVVLIRNFIGNIRILVPYDVEISIHHSVLAGSTSIFGMNETKLFNQVCHFQTMNYEPSAQKIKIFTSMIAGNLEVGRI